jgi:hypothetical protein
MSKSLVADFFSFKIIFTMDLGTGKLIAHDGRADTQRRKKTNTNGLRSI